MLQTATYPGALNYKNAPTPSPSPQRRRPPPPPSPRFRPKRFKTGTGKTTTVVALVREAVARGWRCLVCAPSNVAVDGILERLVAVEGTGGGNGGGGNEGGRKSGGGRPRVVRMGHPARLLPQVIVSREIARDRALGVQEARARVARSNDRSDVRRKRRVLCPTLSCVICVVAVELSPGPLASLYLV